MRAKYSATLAPAKTLSQRSVDRGSTASGETQEHLLRNESHHRDTRCHSPVTFTPKTAS